MIKTPILSGTEVCVEGLDGLNVAVKNLSDSPIWASIYPNITAGADNVVEIPAGSGEVVFDAHGTVYLLGNGKVQCTGTDYATINFKMPSSSASGGGGEGGGVSQGYVDSADTLILQSAKKYTDDEIAAVETEITNASTSALESAKGYTDGEITKAAANAKSYTDSEITKISDDITAIRTSVDANTDNISALDSSKADKTEVTAAIESAVTEVERYVDKSIPTSLPANGGNADRLFNYNIQVNKGTGNARWVKFAELDSDSNSTASIKCSVSDVHLYKGNYPDISDEHYGIFTLLWRCQAGNLERAEIQWEYANAAIKPEAFVFAYYFDGVLYHIACFANLKVSYVGLAMSVLNETFSSSDRRWKLLTNETTNVVGTETIPAEYTTIIPSTVMPLLNTQALENEITKIKAFIDYSEK